MGAKNDYKASCDSLKPPLSENTDSRARLLGEGHTLNGNNTPVRVYCGARGQGLAAGDQGKVNRKEKFAGL